MITSPTALLRAALALVVCSLPNLATALGDITPPGQIIVREDFVPFLEQWQPTSGAWSISAGTYNSTAAGATDISRVVHYREIDPSGIGDPTLRFDQHTVSARMQPASNPLRLYGSARLDGPAYQARRLVPGGAAMEQRRQHPEPATAYIDDTFPARTATQLWHEGEISILMTSDPALTHTVPHDINNRSVVVGESYNTTGGQAPTLRDSTRGQDLNALNLVTPMLINNRGQIVAHGVDSRRTDGRESWYLLTPAAQQ